MDKFSQIIIDTGPLLALLNRNDKHHSWVIAQLKPCTEPMLTCESVLSETVFLLKRQSLSTTAIITLLERSELQIPRPLDYTGRTAKLLKKYADLPTSIADVGLIELSEHFPRLPVLSFDTDFNIYRRADRTQIPLLSI